MYCVGVHACARCTPLPLFLDAPQAAVVCEGKLYLVRDNYQDWPLSKFTTMCLQRISHPQYEVIKQALITDVHSLVSCARQL